MDQVKQAGEMVSNEAGEQQETTRELRVLSDLETMLASGGDGVVVWG